MKFKDKIVLITGASRGIGKATALLFAQEGAKVIVNYSQSKNEADMVVSEIKKMKSDAISVKCDVSNEKQVNAMVERVIHTFGGIDILVNNAGIVFDASFTDRTVEQWKRTLDVNVIGVFLCCKYVAPSMLKKGGSIVNVSSINGINSFNPDSMDYDASKAGVIVLTRDLAKELAPAIRVNAVAPGWVDTAMNKDLPKDYIRQEIKKIYLKRFARPDEIAKVILFLASDNASYITGSILRVDGGYT
ncbi:MAG: SDR family oxidoreductase [Candidatus Sungbacteria bacterium]|nr:SDR family oxidoreductase [bacterium]MDZ4260092.1 SDR family oxidoreductase [Candidatus Sungbacteria bacterium]